MDLGDLKEGDFYKGELIVDKWVDRPSGSREDRPNMVETLARNPGGSGSPFIKKIYELSRDARGFVIAVCERSDDRVFLGENDLEDYDPNKIKLVHISVA